MFPDCQEALPQAVTWGCRLIPCCGSTIHQWAHPRRGNVGSLLGIFMGQLWKCSTLLPLRTHLLELSQPTTNTGKHSLIAVCVQDEKGTVLVNH